MNPAIANFLANCTRQVAKHATKILLVASTALVTYFLTSKSKDKAYAKLIEKHDKETAEKISKEMNEKIDELEERYKNNEKKLKEEINNLFRQYGLDPIY